MATLLEKWFDFSDKKKALCKKCGWWVPTGPVFISGHEGILLMHQHIIAHATLGETNPIAIEGY